MRSHIRLWVLRLCSVLSRPFARQIAVPGAIRRILIIRPDQLGDVLLSLPAIEMLTKALPEAQITLMVGPWGRPALGEAAPGAVLLCPFPGFQRAHLGRVQPYLLLLRYAWRLRRGQGYDLAVILRPDHWWGAFLVCLAGIPLRVGYATPESLPFLTATLPVTPGRHAAVDALHLAAQAVYLAGPSPLPSGAGQGLPVPPASAALPPVPMPHEGVRDARAPSEAVDSATAVLHDACGATPAHENSRPRSQHPDLSGVYPSIRIYPEAVFIPGVPTLPSDSSRRPEEGPMFTPAAFPLPRRAREGDYQMVRDLLHEAGVAAGQDLVVLHPGSNSFLKAWLLPRFAAVGRQLAGELGARLVVTGIPAERDLAQQLCDLLPAGALNLAGSLRWTETEALLARARLVVGVDSGPLHLAVAVDTPSAALFGPADPVQFGPWGSPARHRVVVADLPCRPCRRLDVCALAPGIAGPPPCMQGITSDRVLGAAHAALAAGS